MGTSAGMGLTTKAIRRRHRITGSALLLIVLCVAAWGSFYHVTRNPRYTAAALGLRVAELERQSYEITGYRLFQREYAAVAWYLRHPFLHLEEPEKLKPEVDLTSFEAWDSAAAINLIVLLEELGVEINEDKIRACTTVQDVLNLTGDTLQ